MNSIIFHLNTFLGKLKSVEGIELPSTKQDTDKNGIYSALAMQFAIYKSVIFLPS